MVKIRLARAGKKNDPVYRIVAIDERKKLNGKAISILGHWHPAKNEKTIDKKGIAEWLAKGAKLTPGVAKLLK
jgi:small subunit ribosomal protein S16